MAGANPPSPPFRKGGVIEIKPNGAIGLDDNLTPPLEKGGVIEMPPKVSHLTLSY